MKIYIIPNYKDKYPTLTGKGLTDALINSCLADKEGDESCNHVKITRTKKGKPYCEQLIKNKGIHFSVSHSKDIFACIIAGENIGIDVQHKRNVSIEKLANRYFTSEEAQLSVDADEFYRLWTRKEAYSKFTGEGLGQVMNNFDVLHRDDVEFIDLMIEDEENDVDCFCAVCVKATDATEERRKSIDEIQIFS